MSALIFTTVDEVPLVAGGPPGQPAEIRAHDPDGRQLGNLVLEFADDAGARDIVAVNVTSAHRRTGVATAMFRQAERLGLNPSTQSVFFTPAGRAFVDSLIDRRPQQTSGDVTLFHHTSPVAAAAIMQQRRMTSAAPGDQAFAFFSNQRAGNASGPLHYGEACVEVQLPSRLLLADESFRDGEVYYRVRLGDIRPEHFIRAHYPQQPRGEGRAALRASVRLERHATPVTGAAPGHGRPVG